MAVTIDELVAEARSRLDRVAPADYAKAVENGALVVDVRDTRHRERQGDLPGAEVIDLTVLEWRLAPSSPHRVIDVRPGQQVILVCRHGYSSSLAAARLQDLGIENASDVAGGYRALKPYLITE